MYSADLKRVWWEYHRQNPQVYELVEKFTFEVINRGKATYSINAIFERIRWHSEIETDGEEFKLSNNHRAYYARLFMHYHPEHEGFFKTKPTKDEIQTRKEIAHV